MTPPDASNETAGSGRIIISVDAMGGDEGPKAVVAGIARSAEKNSKIGFILHGPAKELTPLIQKRGLADRCEVRDVSEVVTMDAKPSYVMRHGKGTSMWSAIDAVKNGEAEAAVSCGNTGALMAVSMIRLRLSLALSQPRRLQRHARCRRRYSRR